MVKDILELYPHTRNDDAQLTFAIIWKYLPKEVIQMDGRSFISTDALKTVREDNVKRIRAKYNEEGFYLPTDSKVIERRKSNQKDWKRLLNY